MWVAKIHRPSRKTSGFTIVELLIVIVIIAILASITVVAYNGVQKRAYVSQSISAVQTYKRAIMSYATINGTYPTVGSGGVCLGTGYVDRNSDGIADCGAADGGGKVDATFNAQLRTLVSIPAATSYSFQAPFSSSQWVGAYVENWDQFKVNNVVTPYMIRYALPGKNQNCGDATVVEEYGGGRVFPDMKTSTSTYSWSDNNSTMCLVPLPNLQ